MALFSTIRSAERSPPRRNRSAEDPRSPQTEQAEAPFTLPRHLLVSLAGLTADVAYLQQHCDDAREVEVALDTMLGKLDHLVDSIYQCAAMANDVAHPSTESDLPHSDHHSEDTTDHGRRQTWPSESEHSS